MALRLVVGLGNPGNDYQATRHNIGFDVLDEWSKAAGFHFNSEKLGPVEIAKHEGLLLLKPQTYMNRSGEAIREWLAWMNWSVEEILVVVDDVALPLGELRFRTKGSPGGHNGLRSIEENLGTDQYARLRCGIGPLPEEWPLHHFVTARFQKEEAALREQMIKRAVDALRYCQREGIQVAMNRFNGQKDLESEKDK